MAASVIQTLSKFRLPTAFQHSFPSAAACQELIFQDLSEEEEMEEEEDEEDEEEREVMEKGDNSAGHSPYGAFAANASSSSVEMTGQLLRFAERISNDIQRYFGRKSKEEDSDACNIYEDCCSPLLSGRALYYTDLVRISQSRELEEDEGSPASPEPPELAQGQLWKSFCSKEEAKKLGPLAELFEYGLHRHVKQQVSSDTRKWRLERKYGHITPMHGRKLPQSFWKEPSLSPIGMLNGNPPDFSDLLANWTSETCQEELNTSREQAGEASRQVTDTDHFGGL